MILGKGNLDVRENVDIVPFKIAPADRKKTYALEINRYPVSCLVQKVIRTRIDFLYIELEFADHRRKRKLRKRVLLPSDPNVSGRAKHIPILEYLNLRFEEDPAFISCLRVGFHQALSPITIQCPVFATLAAAES